MALLETAVDQLAELEHLSERLAAVETRRLRTVARTCQMSGLYLTLLRHEVMELIQERLRADAAGENPRRPRYSEAERAALAEDCARLHAACQDWELRKPEVPSNGAEERISIDLRAVLTVHHPAVVAAEHRAASAELVAALQAVCERGAWLEAGALATAWRDRPAPKLEWSGQTDAAALQRHAERLRLAIAAADIPPQDIMRAQGERELAGLSDLVPHLGGRGA